MKLITILFVAIIVLSLGCSESATDSGEVWSPSAADPDAGAVDKADSDE